MTDENKSGYDLTTRQPMGAIFSDGMGAMVADADLRPFLDIMIEPGATIAPFEGLNAEDITTAFAEARGDDLLNKAVSKAHQAALTIHQALVKHESRFLGEQDERSYTWSVASYHNTVNTLMGQDDNNRAAAQQMFNFLGYDASFSFKSRWLRRREIYPDLRTTSASHLSEAIEFFMDLGDALDPLSRKLA